MSVVSTENTLPGKALKFSGILIVSPSRQCVYGQYWQRSVVLLATGFRVF